MEEKNRATAPSATVAAVAERSPKQDMRIIPRAAKQGNTKHKPHEIDIQEADNG